MLLSMPPRDTRSGAAVGPSASCPLWRAACDIMVASDDAHCPSESIVEDDHGYRSSQRGSQSGVEGEQPVRAPRRLAINVASSLSR